MELPQQIDGIFEYHDWANHQILEATRRLSPDELDRDLGGSFSTFLKTLQHILLVEMLFFERWQRMVPGRQVEMGTADQIQTAWVGLEKERRTFLSALTPDQLNGEIRYLDTRGRPVCLQLWQAVFQCVNHSTFHRGQLVEKLRKLGKTPPTTDYVLYCRGVET